MEDIITQVTYMINKYLNELKTLQSEHGGNVDAHDDKLSSCRKRLDGLRGIRNQLESLLLE